MTVVVILAIMVSAALVAAAVILLIPAYEQENPDLSSFPTTQHPRALQRQDRRDLYAEEWGLTIGSGETSPKPTSGRKNFRVVRHPPHLHEWITSTIETILETEWLFQP